MALPVNAEYRARFGPPLFGLEPEELTLRVIEPLRIEESGVEKIIDIVGIVETLEGEPLPSGDIACVWDSPCATGRRAQPSP